MAAERKGIMGLDEHVEKEKKSSERREKRSSY